MMNFKVKELRWQEIEIEIARLQSEQRKIGNAITRNGWDGEPGAWGVFDVMGEQIRMLNLEQQEIEEFLIENEAPGWTST